MKPRLELAENLYIKTECNEYYYKIPNIEAIHILMSDDFFKWC